MVRARRTFRLITALLFVAPLLHARVSESSVLDEWRGFPAASTPQSPVMVIKIAHDIRTLPAGPRKLLLADGLAHLASRDDPGQHALQAVGETLSQSLS
jgi:hypothetical protein